MTSENISVENKMLMEKIHHLEKIVNNITKNTTYNIIEEDVQQYDISTKHVKQIPIIDENKKIPNTVFIVPYRDRKPQRLAFMKIMPHILEDLNHIVLFVHQCDNRPFNRGAMKNLGFIFIKSAFPNHYKNIDFVFHDIDVMPWRKNQFSYKTKPGLINHFYGFPHALGGIFAIKGADFEQINGFPNIWTWGLEDNMLFHRTINLKKKIVRPDFIHIGMDGID